MLAWRYSQIEIEWIDGRSYKDFVEQNRIVKMSIFLKRWWDYNEVKDPQTGEKVFKKDEQLFFVVAPLDVSFPVELQMQSFYW